jgi:predicted dehydrogenase
LRRQGHKQAANGGPILRSSGAGGAIGDIGTHAFHLLEYISGLEGDGDQRDVCAAWCQGADSTTIAMHLCA